ncbi:hypothetical protein LX36DRAFT_300804 [Colletotrichum falcatum]|nr:hypothetical protein LX36DRAFT_300804 [Colletotrichum falcatum]
MMLGTFVKSIGLSALNASLPSLDADFRPLDTMQDGVDPPKGRALADRWHWGSTRPACLSPPNTGRLVTLQLGMGSLPYEVLGMVPYGYKSPEHSKPPAERMRRT